MFSKTLLALAAGGAIMFASLTGSTGTAQADTSVHIGIGVPGVHLAHSRNPVRCWLPERHLCGPYYGRPYYGRPVYGYPVYAPPVYGYPVYAPPVYGYPVYGSGYWAPPVYYRTGRYRHW
ncbi:MAG TPA: hypothetical protein VMN43_11565 [Aestuariivirgaceae bacterium]|nr:hypothetical protein [Aestuariivirgaceae bacterium]